MATYTYPSGAIYRPTDAHVWIEPSVLVSQSPLTKSTRARDLQGDKWRMTLTFGPVRRRGTVDEQAEREAFWNRVGLFHTVAMWHPARSVPRGTMRGSPALAAAAAQGATTLTIATAAGATLLAGDMIGVGGELVQVVADATAAGGGQMTVSVAPKLKRAKTVGAALVWSMPTAVMAVQSPVEIPYVPGYSPGFTVDLSER